MTDVNDNAPKFELPDYQAHNVDEDIPLGTSILKVKAMDADSGKNAEIEYLVSGTSNDSGTLIEKNYYLRSHTKNSWRESRSAPGTQSVGPQNYVENLAIDIGWAVHYSFYYQAKSIGTNTNGKKSVKLVDFVKHFEKDETDC